MRPTTRWLVVALAVAVAGVTAHPADAMQDRTRSLATSLTIDRIQLNNDGYILYGTGFSRGILLFEGTGRMGMAEVPGEEWELLGDDALQVFRTPAGPMEHRVDMGSTRSNTFQHTHLRPVLERISLDRDGYVLTGTGFGKNTEVYENGALVSSREQTREAEEAIRVTHKLRGEFEHFIVSDGLESAVVVHDHLRSPEITSIEPTDLGYDVLGEGFEDGMSVGLDGESLPSGRITVVNSERISIVSPCLQGGRHAHTVDNSGAFTASQPPAAPTPFDISQFAALGQPDTGPQVYAFGLDPLPNFDCIGEPSFRVLELGYEFDGYVAQNDGRLHIVMPRGDVPQGVYTLEVVVGAETSTVPLPVWGPVSASLIPTEMLGSEHLVTQGTEATFNYVGVASGVEVKFGNGPVRVATLDPSQSGGTFTITVPQAPSAGSIDVTAEWKLGSYKRPPETVASAFYVGPPIITQCGAPGLALNGSSLDLIFPGQVMEILGENLMPPANSGLSASLRIGDSPIDLAPPNLVSASSSKISVSIPSGAVSFGNHRVSVNNGLADNDEFDCLATLPWLQPELVGPNITVLDAANSSLGYVDIDGEYLLALADQLLLNGVEIDFSMRPGGVIRGDAYAARAALGATMQSCDEQLQVDIQTGAGLVSGPRQSVLRVDPLDEVEVHSASVVDDRLHVQGAALLRCAYQSRLYANGSATSSLSALESESTESELVFDITGLGATLVSGEAYLAFVRNSSNHLEAQLVIN